MLFKDKLKLIFLSIITFGIYPAMVFRKKDTEVSATLSESSTIKLDINKLISNLGGKDNVKEATATHTKVNFKITSRDNVDIESLQNMKGISGVFATSTSVTIIVGNTAKKIADII